MTATSPLRDVEMAFADPADPAGWGKGTGNHGEPADPADPFWRRLRGWLTSPHGLLVVVCVAHAVMSLVFVVAGHMWWEDDETVYLSQVAAHLPALNFTPPRARGMPVILSPVAHFTTNVTIIRTYLTLLGSLVMYAGFRPWLKLGFGRMVGLAALLYSGLWVTTFFGAETQPNYLVAAVGLGAVGSAVLAIRTSKSRRYLIAVVAWLAVLALLRPSDATWMAAPLILALIVMWRRPWRPRLRVGAAVLGGLVLGWSQWVIEAFTSYGGFFKRLHDANGENTPGLHFSLLTQARAINGPTLCRPCGAQPLTLSHYAWWFAVPPLIAIGLMAARGTRRFLPLAAATACATAVLAEYVFTINYAAPRFLLPVYALLALPAAAGVVALVRWRPPSPARYAVGTVAAVLIAAQLALQVHALTVSVDRATVNRGRYLAAARILRTAGIGAPCVVQGKFESPVAFALGCSDIPRRSDFDSSATAGRTVIELARRSDAAKFPGAQAIQLPGSKVTSTWTAYVLRTHESPGRGLSGAPRADPPGLPLGTDSLKATKVGTGGHGSSRRTSLDVL